MTAESVDILDLMNLIKSNTLQLREQVFYVYTCSFLHQGLSAIMLALIILVGPPNLSAWVFERE